MAPGKPDHHLSRPAVLLLIFLDTQMQVVDEVHFPKILFGLDSRA